MSERKDISNQRFGRLTAIRPMPEMGSPLKWECLCDCGNTVYVSGAKLRYGSIKSCGCYNRERIGKIKEKNLVGMRFGRLVVIEKAYSKNNRVYWLCQCDCGNQIYESTNKLTTGHKKSCGCIRNTLGGDSKTKLYKRWVGMHARCRKNDPSHEHYYDRGISVCDEWCGTGGFLNFKNWALSNGYSEDLTIDRINNDKGYSPSNCRWVTMYVQNNNRTDNHYVTINGHTKTLSQWSTQLGIKYSTVKSRIQNGYDDYSALGIQNANDVIL